MYKLNLARDYRANSGENTWREMFLLRYHCWYEVNSKAKESLKKYNFRRKCSNNTKQLQTA